jgi:hypothetical protein
MLDGDYGPQTSRASNPDGAVQEAGRGDRSGAKRNGRKDEADEVEAQRRKEAVNFLRFYFGIGNDGVSKGEALLALDCVISLLRGQQVPDMGFRLDFESWEDRVIEESV